MGKNIIINTNDESDGPKRRLRILQRNLEQAEHQMGLRRDDDNVFLMMDVTDQDLSSLSDDDAIWVKRAIDDDMIPTCCMVVGRWWFYKQLRKMQRDLHQHDPRNCAVSPIVEQLREPPKKGHFYAMVISGGKSLVQLPYGAE